MLSLQLPNSEYLELKEGQGISLKFGNPITQRNAIPGVYSFPFKLPDSRHNRKLLGNPENLARTTLPQKVENVRLKVGGLVYKQGNIIYRGFSGTAYEYIFQADASQHADHISNTLLNSIIMETDVVDAQTLTNGDGEKFVLRPVYNPAFDPEDSSYKQYLNYYNTSSSTFESDQPLCPFPKLSYVLDQIAKSIGFTLQGSFLADQYYPLLVVISNKQVKINEGFFLQDHLPNTTVGKFLVALQNALGLAIYLDGFKKTITIHNLKYVLKANQVDITDSMAEIYQDKIKDFGGVLFTQNKNADDQVFKERDSSFLEHRAAGEKIKINTAFSPLVLSEITTNEQTWKVPEMQLYQQKETGLRLMHTAGQWTNSNDESYPALDNAALLWSWIVPNKYSQWMAMLQQSRQVSRKAIFRLPDLFNLPFDRPVLIEDTDAGIARFIVDQLSIQVTTQELKPASLKLWKI